MNVKLEIWSSDVIVPRVFRNGDPFGVVLSEFAMDISDVVKWINENGYAKEVVLYMLNERVKEAKEKLKIFEVMSDE